MTLLKSSSQSKVNFFVFTPIAVSILYYGFIIANSANMETSIANSIGGIMGSFLWANLIAYGIFKIKKGVLRELYWKIFFYTWLVVFSCSACVRVYGSVSVSN